MPAKNVNDHAENQTNRGAFTFSQVRSHTPVGAGLPAKNVNDDAENQTNRGAFTFFPSQPAPPNLSRTYVLE